MLLQVAHESEVLSLSTSRTRGFTIENSISAMRIYHTSEKKGYHPVSSVRIY